MPSRRSPVTTQRQSRSPMHFVSPEAPGGGAPRQPFAGKTMIRNFRPFCNIRSDLPALRSLRLRAVHPLIQLSSWDVAGLVGDRLEPGSKDALADRYSA